MQQNPFIYVIFTKKKVIFDFGITDRLQIIEILIQLFKRMINRFLECKIQKIVSDDYKTIIEAVKSFFPEVTYSFCVFHQSKNITDVHIDDSNTATIFQIVMRLYAMR